MCVITYAYGRYEISECSSAYFDCVLLLLMEIFVSAKLMLNQVAYISHGLEPPNLELRVCNSKIVDVVL